MFGMMMGEIFLNALVLMTILYLIARHEADYSFQKVAMVTAGIALGNIAIQAFVVPKIGPWAILAQLAFSAAMIANFCWTTPMKTAAVVAIFLSVQIAIAVAKMVLLASILGPAANPVRTEQRIQETAALAKELMANARQAAATNPPPAKTAAPPVRASPPPRPATQAAPPGPSPAAAAPPTNAISLAEARKALRVSGFVRRKGETSSVLVNGAPYSHGDIVSAPHAGRVYRWRVRLTGPSSAEFDPVEAP